MNHFTTLRHAAAAGETQAVSDLIANGAIIAEMDNAAMRWALRHNRPNIVKLLLGAGADIADNIAEFLTLAAKNGDDESLRQLLNMKLPILPNALDYALYEAINAKHAGAVRILLEAGASPVADNDKAVMLAASVGSAEILESLQAHGADLLALESQPLFNAVMAEDPPSVRLLLHAGADPNNRMAVSLVMAISNGDSEIVELLLGAGAKLPTPDLVDHCATNDSIETLLLLTEYGYPYDPYADEIAKCAAGNSSLRILKFILEKSIVSQSGCNGALFNAVAKPSAPILDLLLEHGADAGADHSGALKAAVEAGHFSHVQKLLAANAHVPDLNSKSLLRVMDAGEWPLLVMLLNGGVSVAGLTLAGDPAVGMFNHVAPADLLRDPVGNFLPRQLCDERKTFVLVSAKIAVAVTPEQKIPVAQWLTEFLIQYNSI